MLISFSFLRAGLSVMCDGGYEKAVVPERHLCSFWGIGGISSDYPRFTKPFQVKLLIMNILFAYCMSFVFKT